MTTQQQRALHLLFEHVAVELNNSGLTPQKVIRADIPWNKVMVKEFLWKPLQLAQLGKKSTKELDTKEIDMVLDTLTKALGELGLPVVFPSIEYLIDERREI